MLNTTREAVRIEMYNNSSRISKSDCRNMVNRNREDKFWDKQNCITMALSTKLTIALEWVQVKPNNENTINIITLIKFVIYYNHSNLTVLQKDVLILLSKFKPSRPAFPWPSGSSRPSSQSSALQLRKLG